MHFKILKTIAASQVALMLQPDDTDLVMHRHRWNCLSLPNATETTCCWLYDVQTVLKLNNFPESIVRW